MKVAGEVGSLNEPLEENGGKWFEASKFPTEEMPDALGRTPIQPWIYVCKHTCGNNYIRIWVCIFKGGRAGRFEYGV